MKLASIYPFEMIGVYYYGGNGTQFEYRRVSGLKYFIVLLIKYKWKLGILKHAMIAWFSPNIGGHIIPMLFNIWLV